LNDFLRLEIHQRSKRDVQLSLFVTLP